MYKILKQKKCLEKVISSLRQHIKKISRYFVYVCIVCIVLNILPYYFSIFTAENGKLFDDDGIGGKCTCVLQIAINKVFLSCKTTVFFRLVLGKQKIIFCVARSELYSYFFIISRPVRSHGLLYKHLCD